MTDEERRVADRVTAFVAGYKVQAQLLFWLQVRYPEVWAEAPEELRQRLAIVSAALRDSFD